jgi:hypothetical protein
MTLFISDTLEAGGLFPIASGAFSGSLTQVIPGVPFIVAQGSIMATTNSLGQIILSGSGGGGGGPGSLIGLGGTSVTTVGSNAYISSSVTNLSGAGGSVVSKVGGAGNTSWLVSGSSAVSPYASFITWTNQTGSLPNSLQIVAGDDNIIVSASVGRGLITISDDTTYIGDGGTTVTGPTFGVVIISSSLVQVSGTGGSSVSVTDSNFLVSSSIYANASASFLVASASSGVPNERVLTAGANIRLVDGGAGSGLTISATAQTGSTGPRGPGGIVFANMYQVAGTTVLSNIGLAFVSTSLGPINISLPNITQSMTASIMLIKDVQGSSSVNPFTIYPTGGARIDAYSGSYTYYINFGALKLTTDGGKDWWTW